MEWEIIPRDEQETIINIDYEEKKIMIYTNRKSVAERLERRIGKPTGIDKIGGKTCGVTYKRNLYDKDLAKFFSKTLLVGAFRKDSEE